MRTLTKALLIAVVIMFMFYAYAYYLHVTDPYEKPLNPVTNVHKVIKEEL